MSWKNFLYYSRKESLAVLFIVVIILLTLNVNILLSNRNSNPLTIAENDSLIASFESLHSNMQEEEIGKQQINYSKKENTNNPQSKYKVADKALLSKGEQIESKYPRQDKLKDSEFIYLNEMDTTQWKKIPGIGSSYAARIIKYRNSLGGFTSINQLKEVYGVDNELFDKISHYIKEESNTTDKCKKLEINKLEFKEILAHPYIDYEQTKAIVNLRKRIGKISSIEELAMLDIFTSEDINRIVPYLQF